MTSEQKNRLAGLIPRLSSESDGEIVATVHAIRRTLDAAGHDLHDLTAWIVGAPVPEGRPTDDTPEWRVMVETALRLQLWRNRWEYNFLNGVRHWAGEPTEKQMNILTKIYNRGAEWE